MSPESLPFGGSGLKGDLLRRHGTSCRGKGLAWATRTVSRQGSCRGSPLRPLCSSWSWPWRSSSSLELRSYPGSPPLLCLVWLCPWLRLPVHSYRDTKSIPLFLYTDSLQPEHMRKLLSRFGTRMTGTAQGLKLSRTCPWSMRCFTCL